MLKIFSRFCTVNCQSSVENYHLYHIGFGVRTSTLRGPSPVCYHCAPQLVIELDCSFCLLCKDTWTEASQRQSIAAIQYCT